jgi:hypothetical protein
MSAQAKGPAVDRASRQAATTQARGDHSRDDRHDVVMYGLAWRIAWLQSHRHWWLRTDDGRAQLEFLEGRDAA